MKRNLLFALFAVLMGLGIVKADNININVDNAANVKVSVDNGAVVLNLMDGMNRITDYTSANSPLMIQAADGASIVSVTKNGSTVLNPNPMGIYAMGIEPMMLDIVTSGSGTPGVQNYDVWFQLNGDPASATILCDGEYVEFSSSTMQYAKIPSATDCVIAPAEGYSISAITANYGTLTDNNDGTWTFVAQNNGAFVDVTTKADEVIGTHFKVLTSYYPNIEVSAYRFNGDDEFRVIPVENDGSAVLPEGWAAVSFAGADDASIVSVKRNGQPVNYSEWVGWRSMIEEGDVFEVVAQGPEKEVSFYANSFRNGVGLEYFTVVSDGKTFDLSGEYDTAVLRRGADVTVSGKGTAVCNYVICGDTRIYEAPFEFNLGNNNLITVDGTAVNGVEINVNDASAVIVKQFNGYGDVLVLNNGVNNFEVADIENNLNIRPADGCVINSVVVNGTAVNVSGNGAYSIAVENGMKIEINARRIPTEVPVTVMLMDSSANNAPSDALVEGVSVTVGEESVELTGSVTTLMANYLDVVTVTSSYGYVIDNITAGNNAIESADDKIFTFTAENPCSVMIYMHKVTASAGNALVNVERNSDKVVFLPYDKNMNRLDGSIRPDAPAVLEIGGYVEVSKFSFDDFFRSITVNGQPLTDENGEPIDFMANPATSQSYFVKIEGDCTIKAELYNPNADRVNVKCWDARYPEYAIKLAALYVNDNGTLTDSYAAIPGEEIELVVDYVAPGYNLSYLQGIEDAEDVKDFEMDENGNYVFKYVVPMDASEYGLIFMPVCQQDPYNPPVVLEFYQTVVKETMESVSGVIEYDAVVGYLEGIDEYEDTTSPYLLATAGQNIEFYAYERDDYELKGIYAEHALENGEIYKREIEISYPQPFTYTVDINDAYEFQGIHKINLIGDFAKRQTSVEGVEADNVLSYNADENVLTASGDIKVFNAAGILVANGTDTLDVANLASGIYIAVSGKSTVKFVKK